MMIFWLLVCCFFVIGAANTWMFRNKIERIWPRIGKLVEAQNEIGHVVERGAGPDVVVLHGAASNARELLAAFEGRLENVKLIAPDRPGLGYSGVPKNAHKLGVQAAFLTDIITKTAQGPIVGVGHSWGSAVLLRLALDRPDLVKSLVLLAPASHPWKKTFNLANFLAGVPVVGHLLVWTLPSLAGPLLMNKGIARGFEPGPVTPANYADIIGTQLFFRPKSFKANAADMEAGSHELGLQAVRYAELKIPVTVVSGQGDVIVFNSIHAAGLARDIPQTKSYRVPAAGHMPHWVDTPLVEAIVLAHAFDTPLPASEHVFSASG